MNPKILELLTLETKIDKLLSKIYVYSYLGFYDNMGDVKFQQCKESASALSSKVSSATSFIVPEILSSDFSLIEDYINKNNKLELYRRSLEIIFREKEHILSENEEIEYTAPSFITALPAIPALQPFFNGK